jgi:glycosyltransferase involved in cell wall biosynthesis
MLHEKHNSKIDSNPLVSVVMCTYNGEIFLPLQLDTIINQSYTNLEIIIVDDCSADKTKNIVDAYRAKDRRIKFYSNETNLGYNKNFEKACTIATGEYIAICDQDDVWALHKIETMLSTWNDNSIFIYSLSRDFWGDKPITEEENKPIRYYEGNMPEKLCFDSPIHGHACMFKRTLLAQAIPFPANAYYDWWLSMIASSVDKVSCIKKTLTYHRLQGNNSSREILDIKQKDERTAKLRQVCLNHMNAFLNSSFAKDSSKTIIEKYRNLLQSKHNNKFSWKLFVFFFTNREITFHYKRNRNIFSLLKNSFKRAFTGL